ncbi:hypothetical protein F4811DRAFT_552376 [Daldinia bambusicola]|nr:hypothetical protein F4811DRAFT_552376 [Daldinia bambusicola]
MAANTHILLIRCRGLDNSYITDEERRSLIPGDVEYNQRIETGDSWDDLIYFGLVVDQSSNVSILQAPYYVCYPISSPYNTFTMLSLNIITSIYILALPLPVLWMANIKLWKKIALMLLVSTNGFVVVVASLRGYWATSSKNAYGTYAIEWTYRVCFVAIVTTNVPLLFPLLNRLVIMPLNKPQLKTLRRIREIKSCKPGGMDGQESYTTDDSDSGCLPKSYEDPCLSDLSNEDSRTSSDFYSLDIEMYGDPRTRKEERTANYR